MAEKLDDLHAAITSVLLDQIKNGEPNAAMLNVARQFLKDNNVTSAVKHDANLAALSQAVPFSEHDEYGLPQ